jgi:hypothetical protein
MKSEIEQIIVCKINKPVELTNSQGPYACLFL